MGGVICDINFSVRLEQLSGPSKVCQKCNKDVAASSGDVASINFFDRKVTGTYTYAIWAKATSGVSFAPVYLTVVVVPDHPYALEFMHCPLNSFQRELHIAGSPFTRQVQVQDKYRNPTTGWENPIVLSAEYQGGLRELQEWKAAPPTATATASPTAVFQVAITQSLLGDMYTIVARSSGWYTPKTVQQTGAVIAQIGETSSGPSAPAPAPQQLELALALCPYIQVKPDIPVKCEARIDVGNGDRTMLKAGSNFMVKVQFFDQYDNLITQQLSQAGREAQVTLHSALGAAPPKGVLMGMTQKVITGAQMVFTGLSYEKGPDTIVLAVSVPAVQELAACVTKPLRIIPDDPNELKVVEIRKKTGGNPQKPPLAAIMGPSGGVSGSPLFAGEKFCVVVEVHDRFGNVVDETDPEVRKRYKKTGDGRPSGNLPPFVPSMFGGLGGPPPLLGVNFVDPPGPGFLAPPASNFLQLIGGGPPPFLGPPMGGGVKPPPPMGGGVTVPIVTPTVATGRTVRITRKQCTPNVCKQMDETLKGTTSMTRQDGRFAFCDTWYERTECIIVKASSEGLRPDTTEKICVDHAIWRGLACDSDVRRVPQYRPMGQFLGTLRDRYGNLVTNCARDFAGGCTIKIQEMPEGDGYIPGGALTNPSLPSGQLIESIVPKGNLVATAASDSAYVTFSNLYYTRGRPRTDPLRLELVGVQASVQAACSGPEAYPIVVIGLRILCVDSPTEVTAGENFTVTGEVSYWNVTQGTFVKVSCPSNKQCTTRSFLSAGKSSSPREEARFDLLEGARGPPAASPDCAQFLTEAACTGSGQAACVWARWELYPFDTETEAACHSTDLLGVAAVDGDVTFQDLSFHRTGTMTPTITPRSPTVSTAQWIAALPPAASDAEDEVPPGVCPAVKVVANTAYEMCMGSTLGAMNAPAPQPGKGRLVDQAFTSTPYQTILGMMTVVQCSAECERQARCRRWTFAAATSGDCALFNTASANEGLADQVGMMSGCSTAYATDAVCAEVMIPGGCEKCVANPVGVCGTCPPTTVLAGQQLTFAGRVHDMFGNLLDNRHTESVNVACRVTSGPPPNSVYEGRLYPWGSMRLASQSFSDGTLGVASTSAPKLKVAGQYEITCWADVTETSGRLRSGLPTKTSPMMPGGVVWTPVMDRQSFDIGEAGFQRFLTASPNKVVKRMCPGCPSESHREIYMRRFTRTEPGAPTVYDMLKSAWTGGANPSPRNVLGVDFDLFSTYEDALANTNAWSYCTSGEEAACQTMSGSETACNLDMRCLYNTTTGVCSSHEVGFPGWCDVAPPQAGGSLNGGNWNTWNEGETESATLATDVTFYVETAPGCTETEGQPVGTRREALGQAASLAECVMQVKEVYHGLSNEEAAGASWTAYDRRCYVEFLDAHLGAEARKEWWATNVATPKPWRSCQFMQVADATYSDVWGYCTCGEAALRCPCFAPPPGEERLRKVCGIDVKPAEADHLKCMQLPAYVWAGTDMDALVAVRDEFENRKTGVFGNNVWMLSEGPSENGGLDPLIPTAELEAGIAHVPARYLTAGLVIVRVATDLPKLAGKQFSCPAATEESCCNGKMPCPGGPELVVCPADMARLAFIDEPKLMECTAKGRVISERRFPTIRIGVYDKFGNLKKLTAVNVTLAVSMDGPAGAIPRGTLSGTLSKLTQNGVATFDDISYDVAEDIRLKVGAIEKDAPVSGLTIRLQTRSANVVRVCPGDICRLELEEVPATCTFDVANDPVVVRAVDHAGNSLLPWQTDDCLVSLTVARSNKVTNSSWVTNPSLVPAEDPLVWRRLAGAGTEAGSDEVALRAELLERALYMHSVSREGDDSSESFVVYGGATVLPGEGRTVTSEVLAAVTSYLPAGAPTLRGTVWRFNMRLQQWTRLWSPPETSSPSSPVEGRDYPAARFAHVAVTASSNTGLREMYLFVFGGRTEGSSCCNNELWRFGPLRDSTGEYNASAMSWVKVDVSGGAVGPVQLAHSTGAAYRQKLYVFSGIGGDSTVDMKNAPVAGGGLGSTQLFSVDLQTALRSDVSGVVLSWTRVKLAAGSPLPRGRVQSSSVLRNGVWYVVGGAFWPSSTSRATPTGEIWSLDLEAVETPASTQWTLVTGTGPEIAGGTVALDPLRGQILVFGGSTEVTGQFGELVAAKATAEVHRFDLERQLWLDPPPKGTAVGSAGCAARVGLEWSAGANMLARCALKTSEAECVTSTDCSIYTTAGDCHAAADVVNGWLCGWDAVAGQCVNGCAWQSGGDADAGVVPARRTYAAQAMGQVYRDPTDGEMKVYFFGGATTPSPESRVLCYNLTVLNVRTNADVAILCTGDPDVWTLGPLAQPDTDPYKQHAWDVIPYDQTCTDNSAPGVDRTGSICAMAGWASRALCERTLSADMATPCVWASQAATFTEEQCDVGDGSGCASVSGGTSRIHDSVAEFDHVTVSSVRALAAQFQYCTGKDASNTDACVALTDQATCVADTRCHWQVNALTRQMLLQLQVSVTCGKARPLALCPVVEPVLLPLMRCARCQLTVMPGSTPRTGVRSALVGKEFIGGTGSAASPFPSLHGMGPISVGVTGPLGKALTADTTDLTAGTQIRLSVVRYSPPTATLSDAPLTPLDVVNGAVTLADGTTVPGAVFTTVNWNVSSSPAAVWIMAEHENGMCQDSQPWPINVVPDEACSWVVSQRVSVRAGEAFTVNVLLKDALGNIAYCDVQEDAWRVPVLSGRLLQSKPAVPDWTGCQDLCAGNPRCVMWNYAVADVTVSEPGGTQVVPARTCKLYRGIGKIAQNGWTKLEGAVTGMPGTVPCPEGAFIEMSALSADSLKTGQPVPTKGRLFSERHGLGEAVCFLADSISGLEANTQQQCLQCCRNSGAPYLVEHYDTLTEMYVCGCSTDSTSKDWTPATKCKGVAPEGLGWYITVTEIISQFREQIDSHALTFDTLWHNRAESLVLHFSHSVRADCPATFSQVIEVTPGDPHHLNRVAAPKTVYASLCGPDEAFEVSFEIVDFWNNRVPVAHRLQLRLHQGSGHVDGSVVLSTAGLITFTVEYAVAEIIVLEAVDLDIVGGGEVEEELLAIQDMLVNANAETPLCLSDCFGDSCKNPTPPRCCKLTTTITVLTGPASKLVTVVQPPKEAHSYASGDCSPFSIEVQLQDMCGNPITAQWSGKYASAYADTELIVSVMTRNPDQYKPGETPESLFRVLSDLVLRDGRGVIVATHSRADCGVSVTVAINGDSGASVTPATPDEICVLHCIPNQLRIVEPASCHDLSIENLAVTGAAYTMSPIEVVVLDRDNNICDTPNPVLNKRIGCYKDQQGTALPNAMPVTEANFSINACMMACSAGGFDHFGMQLGSLCYCGSGDSYAKYGVLEESSCATPCAGGKDKNCGGVNANAVYEILTAYATVQLSARDYRLYGGGVLDPRLSATSTAGHGGELVGVLTEPTVEGEVLLDDVIWIPDVGDTRTQCKRNPLGNPNCTGQITIQANDVNGMVTGDTCNMEVKADQVECVVATIDTRVGERFDTWAWIKPVSKMDITTKVNITIFDESGDLEADPQAGVLVEVRGNVTRFVMEFDPTMVPNTENESVWFNGLYYRSTIARGTASVMRRIKVQSTYAQECVVTVRVWPGKSVSCVVTPPERKCFVAGEPFNVQVEARDEMDNLVPKDRVNCMVRHTGDSCPAPLQLVGAVPQSEAEMVALQLLFNPSVRTEMLRLGVTTRRRNGVLELFAEDTLQYVADLRPFGDGGIIWEGGAPPAGLEESVASGEMCIALSKTVTFIADPSAAVAFQYKWKAVKCSDLTEGICSDLSSGADCPTGAAADTSVAMLSLVGNVTGQGGEDVIDGETTLPLIGGVAHFVGLTYTRATRARAFTVSVLGPVGITLPPCVDGDFDLDVSPALPRDLEADIWAEEEVAPGTVCMSCGPHDEFTIRVRAIDEYGNYAGSWECPAPYDLDVTRKVGLLNLQVVEGMGRLVGRSGHRHRSAWPGKKLHRGSVEFRGLRYTKAEAAVFRVNPRGWSLDLGDAPSGPRVGLLFQACFPWQVDFTSVPDMVVAGKPFQVELEIRDRYGNLLTLDPYGLVASRVPVFDFSYLDPLHRMPANRDEQELPYVYPNSPGRHAYLITQRRIRWVQRKVFVDAFGDSVLVLVRIDPVLIADFGLRKKAVRDSGLTCALPRPGRYMAATILNLYHNEPTQLLPPQHDKQVQFDQPFDFGVRTIQFDRFNNFAWDNGVRYGVIGCKLERNYMKFGNLEDILYSPPTEDNAARVQLQVAGTLATFQPTEFLSDFAATAGVDISAVTIVSIQEVTSSSPASASSSRQLLATTTYLIILIECRVPGATTVVRNYIAFVAAVLDKCHKFNTAEACCTTGRRGRNVCLGGPLCVFCVLAVPVEKSVPGVAFTPQAPPPQATPNLPPVEPPMAPPSTPETLQPSGAPQTTSEPSVPVTSQPSGSSAVPTTAEPTTSQPATPQPAPATVPELAPESNGVIPETTPEATPEATPANATTPETTPEMTPELSAPTPELNLTTPAATPEATPELNATTPQENTTASGWTGRRLQQYMSDADKYFLDHELERGLTNALLTPDPVTGEYPQKHYFVPQLMMGTRTDLTTPTGAAPYYGGHVWFRESFTRMMRGTFTLMVTCERLTPSKVRIDDPAAPDMYQVETGLIEVAQNKMEVVKAPSPDVCRRAGDPFAHTVRLLLPSGETPRSAPFDVHLMVTVSGESEKLGPFMCDGIVSAVRGQFEGTCTMNTNTAPNQPKLDGYAANYTRPAGGSGIDRADVWTIPETITEVTIQQDAEPAAEGYTLTKSTVPITFIPACAATMTVFDHPPVEVVVHKPFTVGIELFDRFGNLGGDYTVRILAYDANPVNMTTGELNTAAQPVELLSSWRDGGRAYNDAPAQSGKLQYTDLNVPASFLQGLLARGRGLQGYVWLVAHVVRDSGRGCDGGCDPYSATGAACTYGTVGPSQEFGCLYQVLDPILVTPDEPAACEFLEFPSYIDGGMVAGPLYSERLRAHIVDKWGLPIHKANPSLTANLVLLQGHSLLRKGYPSVSYVDGLQWTSFETGADGLVLSGPAVQTDGIVLGVTLWARLTVQGRLGQPLLVIGSDSATALVVSLDWIPAVVPGVEKLMQVLRVTAGPGTLIELPFEASQLPDEWGKWDMLVTNKGTDMALEIALNSLAILRISVPCVAMGCTDPTDPKLPTSFNSVALGPGMHVFVFEVGSGQSLSQVFLATAERVAFGSIGKVITVPDGWYSGLPMELSFDNPLISPLRFEQTYGVPTECGPSTEPAGNPDSDPVDCIRDGLTYGVVWENVWYSLAETIVIGMNVPGLPVCTTPPIDVRAGPPYKLACQTVADKVYSGDTWTSSVTVQDRMGNQAKCFGLFEESSGVERTIDCTTGTVSVKVAGWDETKVPLLQPRSKATEVFGPDAVALFNVKYNQPPKKPLPWGGGNELPASDLGTTAATLAGFGIDFSQDATGAVEGWDSTGETPLSPASYRGLWTIESSATAAGGRYLSVSALPDDPSNPLFMRYLTNGRRMMNVDCNGVRECKLLEDPVADSCCQVQAPGGRVAPASPYSLQFRLRADAAVDGGKTSDYVHIELSYWTSGPFPRALQAGVKQVVPGSELSGAWKQFALPHTSPTGAAYASIRLMCWKMDQRTGADGSFDGKCRVQFDEVNLVRLSDGESVFLQYSSTLPRSSSGVDPVLPVVCGPTLMVPQIKIPPPPPPSCDPSTCNNHGRCDNSWTCPQELLTPSDGSQGFPEYCCLRALSFCCGGLMRDTADTEFRAKCGNRFCSGNNGKVAVPSACTDCYDDSERGHWAGPNCEKCKDGFYGKSCTERICPTNPKNGRECSGHGLCRSDGQCVCFGTSAAQPGAVPALRMTDDYLQVAPLRSASALAPDHTFLSCSDVLAYYLDPVRSWGLPDNGMFTLQLQGPGAPAESYYCRFFQDKAFKYHGVALVGGAWKGKGKLAGNIAAALGSTTNLFTPFTYLGQDNGAGSRMFEYPGQSGGEDVGRRWLHYTLQDGGEAGGAFARLAPGDWNTIVLSSNPVYLAAAEWVMLDKAELATALGKVISGQSTSEIVLTKAGNGLRTNVNSVCVYARRACPTCTPDFVGIFTKCGRGDSTYWKMWIGEGTTQVGQVLVGSSVRVFVGDSQTGMAFPSEQVDWSGAVPEAGLPVQVSARAGALIRTTTAGSLTAPQVTKWSSWNGRPLLLADETSTGPALGQVLFNTEPTFQALPSPLVEIQWVRLRFFAENRGGVGNDVRYSAVLVTASGRTVKATADQAGVVPGQAPESATVTIHDVQWNIGSSGLSVSDLAGLTASVLFNETSFGGGFDFNGGVLETGYTRIPPLEDFGFSAYLKIQRADETTQMNLFRASHSTGGEVRVDLNTGADGGSLPDSARVKVVDSTGRRLIGVAPGLLNLFSNRWVRLTVNVSLADGTVRVFLGKSKLENGKPGLTEQAVDMAVQDEMLLRSFAWMDQQITFGTDRTRYTGFLRDVILTAGRDANKVTEVELPLNVSGVWSSDSNTVTQQAGEWVPVVVPPDGTSYDGVSVRPVPMTLGYWSGDLCEDCVDGYHGSSCSVPNCQSDAECGMGYCEFSNSSLFYGQCRCYPNYDGAHCDRCDPSPVTAQRFANGSLACVLEGTCPTANMEGVTNEGTLDGAWCAPGGKFVEGAYFDPNAEPPMVNCTVNGVKLCVPTDSVKFDDCGCPTSMAPVCAPLTQGETCCDPTLKAFDTPVSYDCKKYSNLYISCPKRNCSDGGLEAAPRPVCAPSTEGARQYSKFCLNLAAEGCDGSQVRGFGELKNLPAFQPQTKLMRFYGECPPRSSS
eukprot:TRINITY_DN31_c1_g1_i6.p1 TRINITY_DN31_c1_g1~~TRINITY_DN31_c1_g1_i6.p1  ORF type:complete len:7405 (+),score=1355.38 TRINITY_DN31_c1_g1_i6:1745-22216(+)